MKENEPNVVPLRETREQLHRVRATVDPNRPETIAVVEDLISRSDLFRCEVSSEEGESTWIIIVPESLLDRALEGIAVTAPVDFELFENDERKMFFVTSDEWFLLGGIAEDNARCGDADDVGGFEAEVREELLHLIQGELFSLRAQSPELPESTWEEIERKVISDLDIYTWADEDVQESVQTNYEEVIGRMEP